MKDCQLCPNSLQENSSTKKLNVMICVPSALNDRGG